MGKKKEVKNKPMDKKAHAYKIYEKLSEDERKTLQRLIGRKIEGSKKWIDKTIKNLSGKQDLCKEWEEDRFSLKLWYIKNFINQEGCCYYCKIPLEKVRQIYGVRGRRWRHNKQGRKIYTRGFKLEIDRENSANKYTPKKCHLVCFPCNCAKSNVFNEKEFLLIGKLIGLIMNNPLKENILSKSAEDIKKINLSKIVQNLGS